MTVSPGLDGVVISPPFHPAPTGSATMLARCVGNGQYVCAEDSGDSPLIVNRTAVGPWETFAVQIH
ncbi:hypothetical protein JQX13_10355 [Archangium violaceum]|uniref:fascin domain-containing protein n=1 Tax=Archangium violaceum TaxID=83451 RepID=UPI00193B6BF8|nr:hypothetical protein [Archangium violaceum]QRK10452.1 hypothetical protein JQX13_10355 [Archangium violaceum]